MNTEVSDPIFYENSTFSKRYISVEKDIDLLVMIWQPLSENDEKQIPIVFVPGLVSVIDGWKELLKELIPNRPVYYIETREKGSAIIKKNKLKPSEFTVSIFANDIYEVCKQLQIDMSKTIFFGSSYGSTSIIEAFKNSYLKAKGAFLVGPNSEYKAPWMIKMMLFLPADLYHIVKYFILWYLKTFRVDSKNEPEQWGRYYRTLMTAEPHRLKMTARSAVKYSIWTDLDTVKVPIGIASATSDTLHDEKNINRMAETIPNAKLIHCPSNKYMHSAKIAPDIETFIKSLTLPS